MNGREWLGTALVLVAIACSCLALWRQSIRHDEIWQAAIEAQREAAHGQWDMDTGLYAIDADRYVVAHGAELVGRSADGVSTRITSGPWIPTALLAPDLFALATGTMQLGEECGMRCR